MLNKLFSSSFYPTSSVILATDLDGTLLAHKTIILENYEVMLGCVKAGMGKAFVSKIIVDKYGYTNDLKMSKLPENTTDLRTHLVCRKDAIPIISAYLKALTFTM